jgi:hypothetical protein
LLDEIAKHLLPPQNELIEEEIEMIDFIFGRLKEVAKAVNIIRLSVPTAEEVFQNNYKCEVIMPCLF